MCWVFCTVLSICYGSTAKACVFFFITPLYRFSLVTSHHYRLTCLLSWDDSFLILVIKLIKMAQLASTKKISTATDTGKFPGASVTPSHSSPEMQLIPRKDSCSPSEYKPGLCIHCQMNCAVSSEYRSQRRHGDSFSLALDQVFQLGEVE